MSALEEVQALGSALLDAPVLHVKNVARLLKHLVHTEDEDVVDDALRTLRVFFVDALHNNAAHAGAAAADAASKYLAYVRKQYASYLARLLALLRSPASAPVQSAAAVAHLEAVRAESVAAFANDTFKPLCATMLTSRHVHPDVLGTFLAQCVKYADMRFYAAKHVAQLAETLAARSPDSQALQEWQAPPDDVVGTLFDLLSQLAAAPAPADGEQLASWCGAVEAGVVRPAADAREGAQARRKRRRLDDTGGAAAAAPAHVYNAQWASPALQKQAFSSAWLAFLGLRLPGGLFKRVLQLLPSAVMPRLANPLQLSDLLTRAIEVGGLVGILALNGLFTLVTQYGLEYPQFYARVYSLLQPAVLTSRYRLTFLRLVDVFLASKLVPAYTVAAFVKRFARIALTAPPTGAVVAVAFIHNLIRRNPSCVCLLHRPGAEAGAGADVFDAATADPGESRAVESSLWELQALRRHQDATVASFVVNLDKDLTDHRKTSELDSHALMAETDAARANAILTKRLKRAPAVSFYTLDSVPRSLFPDSMPGWQSQRG